jgi:hypothetical protein
LQGLRADRAGSPNDDGAGRRQTLHHAAVGEVLHDPAAPHPGLWRASVRRLWPTRVKKAPYMPPLARARKSTTSQLSANARRIIARTKNASGITDSTFRDLPASAYRALALIGSGTLGAMSPIDMSLHDTEEVPISAEMAARLVAYAAARGLSPSTVADALIVTALEREDARPANVIPVASYLSSAASAGCVVRRTHAPMCDGAPGQRCQQPFHWRNAVRCGCQPASGRNVG